MIRRYLRTVSVSLTCAVLILAARPVSGQSHDGTSSANADKRDFAGVWSPGGSSIPTNDITDHLLPGEEIAFTPYGAERYKTIDHAKDPTNRCGPAGYMRGMQTPLMPFQIVQSSTVMS